MSKGNGKITFLLIEQNVYEVASCIFSSKYTNFCIFCLFNDNEYSFGLHPTYQRFNLIWISQSVEINGKNDSMCSVYDCTYSLLSVCHPIRCLVCFRLCVNQFFEFKGKYFSQTKTTNNTLKWNCSDPKREFQIGMYYKTVNDDWQYSMLIVQWYLLLVCCRMTLLWARIDMFRWHNLLKVIR